MIAARLGAWMRWLDAQTARERVLILAVVLVALYLCADTLAIQPLLRARAAAVDESETVQKRVRALESDVTRLRARAAEDPDAPNREREKQLRAQIAQLDAHLAKLTVEMIDPDDMPQVLRGLLREQPALRLVRLESLPAEPVDLGPPAAADGDPEAPPADPALEPVVFRHGVELELRGTYAATLAYLESLESLSWRFFWDDLEYAVDEYPHASIRLRVYSLSTRTGWIGV